MKKWLPQKSQKLFFPACMLLGLLILVVAPLFSSLATNISSSLHPLLVSAQTFSCDSVWTIPQQECEALVAIYNSTGGSGWTNKTGWLVSNKPCSWMGVGCLDIGGYPSLVLDATDHPHFSYYDNANGDLKYARWDGSFWRIETVDSSGDVGQYTSIALDTHGYPHISYYGVTNQALKYARWDGSFWRIETVDSGLGEWGGYTSLALDANGNPHISYTDHRNQDIKYAYRTGSSWQVKVVDGSVGLWGSYSSLVLDTTDRPHISYYHFESPQYFFGATGDLNYAYWDGSVWQRQTVDSEGDVGRDTSLALDSSGNPHISYNDATNRDLKYAHWDGSRWQMEIVENGGFYDYVGDHTSLVLDAADYPRISYYAYYDAVGSGIKYAHWNGSAWQIEMMVAGPAGRSYEEQLSLVLDTVGNPHLSYDAGCLKYVRWDGVTWQIETVDTGDVRSLNLSQNNLTGSLPPEIGNLLHLGRVLIERNPLGGSLPAQIGNLTKLGTLYLKGNKLAGDVPSTFNATNLPNLGSLSLYWNMLTVSDPQTKALLDQEDPGWEKTQTIPPNNLRVETDFPGETSLRLDTASYPHISFYDVVNQDLKYAYWNGSSWQIETVDSTGEVGEYSSLALDSGNNPHISYYDATNQDLKYATRKGTAWQIETVWSTGQVGQYTSLALNKAGYPHISYYDATENRQNYVYWDGLAWRNRVAITIGDLGENAPLVLDSAGNAYISYHSAIEKDLRYISLSASRYWIVDSNGDVGQDCSLTLDSSEKAHISYYDRTNQDLKYATWKGTAWQVETVDSNGEVGEYTSLALDGLDYPHITYYDRTNQDLKYAHWDGSSWQVQVVDSNGNVGVETSLVLDASGNPHISYYDRGTIQAPTQAFKYARWDGSAWQVGVTGSAYSVGLELNWAPIEYTQHGGYYEVNYATKSGGPYTILGTTADKTVDSYPLDTLPPASGYYLTIRTFSISHDKPGDWTYQPNDLWSSYSNEAQLGTIYGDLDGNRNVDINDLILLLQNWGDKPFVPAADLSGDSKVNGLDFGKMLQLMP